MKIKFLPLNIDGAGCYRCIFPAVALSARGHDAGIPRFIVIDGAGKQVPPLPLPGLLSVRPGDFTIGFMDDDAAGTDVLVVQHGSMKFTHDWIDRYRAVGAKIVVDLDDDLHRVPSYNPGKLDPSVNKEHNRRWAQKAVERADLVTVATPELARFYGRWNENIAVLPNRLHWPMWAELAPIFERREWKRFRVGYMGNVDFHRADLETIAPSLRKWLTANPDVEFVAAGDPRIHDIVGTPEGQRVSTAKVDFRCMDLPYITSTMDVGLAPLLRNDFNEGKSCLKGMEYNACGIPVLATPTEEYRRWIEDGSNGFLCGKPSEFIARLDELRTDGALRESMGRAARYAASQAALDLHIGEWEEAYAGVCDYAVPTGAGVAA